MVLGNYRAERATRNFSLPPPKRASAKDGLRYERKIGKQLEAHVAAERFLKLEKGPWFSFEDDYGAGNCCPDFLLHLPDSIIIVEVKLTWVEVAIHKLNDLYNPVVSVALGKPCFPLIICRNITPASPPAELTLSKALVSPFRILHWPEIGNIRW